MRPVEGDILYRITESVKDRLAREPAPVGLELRAWEAAGVRRRGGRRSLREALTAHGVRIVAECKRRSPSAGVLRQPFDAVELARLYEGGGAAAVSVVTEPKFFGGQAGWIASVRAAVALPVLHKDFLITPRQLFESAVLGADAVLLIARALPGVELAGMVAVAQELGLEVLLEVHDEVDLERAAAVDVPLVGINSRNLVSFAVDLEAASALAERVPPDRVVVMESGISGPSDVRRFAAKGLRQFLVGEHLLRADDPGSAVRELVACA